MTNTNKRKNVNTTLDRDLYRTIKVQAAKLDKNANELIEEGMRLVIKKYSNTRLSGEDARR